MGTRTSHTNTHTTGTNEKDEPIYKLVNGEYVKGNDAPESFYPRTIRKRIVCEERRNRRHSMRDALLKASVGHVSASRRLRAKPKTPKMKRFANVEPRVRSNFASVGKSVVEDSK